MMATTEATTPGVDAADMASPTDSVIAGDFGAMSPQEQEKQREEWKAELARTEEEIGTLKQVLVAKEAHAAGLKRRLGITAWREFSEEMTQGVKNIQESAAYQKTVEGLGVAKEKTAGLWSSVTSSTSFQSVSSAFGAAKTKISESIAPDPAAEAATAAGGAATTPAAATDKSTNGASKAADKK